MLILSRPQRLALRAIFNRAPIFPEFGEAAKPLSYKEFRRSIQPTFGMNGAIIVRWARMWLCIERDGYTHS